MIQNINQYPWLLSPWQGIIQSINAGLPHALLLHSVSGFGKHIIAHELARLLLCQGKKEGYVACAQCCSCGWFAHQETITQQCHPDCYPIASGAESGVIKIDEIRTLIAHLSQTAHQAGWKISIIFKAHRLNNQAFNALLKTLEEPTDNTLFLLLADNLNSVPLTILSRVQHLPLSLDNSEDRQKALSWLAKQGPYDDVQIEQALTLSNNAPLLALEFLSDNKIQQYQQWLDDLIQLQTHQMGIIEMVKKWQHLKEENVIWLYRLIHQRMTNDCSLIDPARYRNWLIYEKALKQHEGSWLQNLNELLVLQSVYAQWRACSAQQAII